MIVLASGIVSEALFSGGPTRGPISLSAENALPTLVLTGHAGLRDRLRSVILGRGAICRAPTSVAAAWRAANADHRLVFIDVARPLDGQVDEARAIAEMLALRQGVLLAVCGRPAEAEAVPPGGDDEEAWARQMGAFVFLPGVGSDAGVAQIVDEARLVFQGGH